MPQVSPFWGRMNSFMRWLGKHEGLAWAGLLLGIAQLFASPQFGLTSVPGITLLVMGGIMVGGIGGSMIAVQRRKHNVDCSEYVQTYEFSGKRGSICQLTTEALLQAKTRIESFVHSKNRTSGRLEHLSTTFRNLGPDGRGNPNPPSFFVLGHANLFETADPAGDGATLMIVPPAPLRKGDFVEVVRRVRGVDCFAGADEFVEKVALFPIKKLGFKLVFHDGLRVTNCSGTKYESGVPVEEGFHPLTPTADSGTTHINWEIDHVRPSESYRVSWRWSE